MPVINNIFNIKVNNVSSNGSISFGSTVHDGHSVNDKSQGTNTSIGDFSPLHTLNKNFANDQDMFDQPQIQPDIGTTDITTAT